ncbi:hypothetical protein RhiirB3_530194 [Rhizophagus irregularis]|nr:hypothetical protein RhiirB3_530194 [Rhizophagus irregularis]
MISENKENDRNSHKLDDDGGGVDNGVHSIGIRPVIFGEHLNLYSYCIYFRLLSW